MFVQAIEGHTPDPDGLRRQHDNWLDRLAPGAAGWLGSTGGVSARGEAILVARFEDAAAARTNSDGPEQGKWWAATEPFYDGAVSFMDSADIVLSMGGGSDAAGFVQVMRGRATDADRMREIDTRFATEVEAMREMRPDVLGGITARSDDGSFVQVNYFTSEAEARAGEQKDPPPDMAALIEEWQSLIEGLRFIDIDDPWLASAAG